MAILNLGVIDLAYVGGDAQATTTGDVAEFLEEDYHVMEVFFEAKKDKILSSINDMLAHQIEALSQGAPVSETGDLYLPEVDSLFRDFLTSGEIESITGQTEAARLGISHRFKDAQNRAVSAQDIASGKATAASVEPVVGRGPRPSFVDTGLYVASFKSWLSPT